LTEITCNENITITSEPEPKSPFEEKIVPRKTIVYETLIDTEVIKIAAENLKDQIFPKYGFLRTSPEEVNITSIDKYYEPYIRISGRYAIEYYRKRVWTLKVADDVSEIIISLEKFKPKRYTGSEGETYMGFELIGEERVRNEVNASLTLNSSGDSVSLKELPASPSEKNPDEALSKYSAEKISSELDLSMLRTKIFKRPANVSWIENELFEVNERLVIYVPRFKVTFKNVKNGKEKTVVFDGITGKLILKDGARLTRQPL
jgi:hypothetical protein